MNLPVLTIASGNQKKVSEISDMLDVLSLRVEKQPEYLNVEETGKTYFENALLKAKAASLETKTWALACLLYTSPSPRDGLLSRMPSSA